MGSTVFEASPEGFRALNMGRSPAHLIRELIQNVFDEAASYCRVTMKHTPKRGLYIMVEDDVPGGIRDERLVFTIWESDKQDSPVKRGRMGRGLKELVSVSDWTAVRTEGRDAIVFERTASGEWSRKITGSLQRPERGTVVEVQVKSWREKDADLIAEYLCRVRPPKGIFFSINGEMVYRKTPLETHKLRLPSVTFVTEDGERRVSNASFTTDVELFSEQQPYVYEMGIPIEPIDFPLSIDVGQRVPLREQRDTLLAHYRSELFAKLLNARINLIPTEQLKDNFVLKAAEAAEYLTPAAKKLIGEAWTGGHPYASTPQMLNIATGQHIPVISLRSLPEAIRDVVRHSGTDVKTILDARRSEFCPEVPLESLNFNEKKLKLTWEWIAAGIDRPCNVVIRDGLIDNVASFERSTSTLSLYRKGLDAGFFDFPLKASQLRILIHELSHWTALQDAHGADFLSDTESVGARVAQFLVENAGEAIHMANQGGG